MKTRSRINTWQRLRQQPTWKLLAADNAPLIAGLLQSLLLDDARQLPASLLHERLARELERPARRSLRRARATGAGAHRLECGVGERAANR